MLKSNYREFRIVNAAEYVTAPSILMGNFINKFWLGNGRGSIIFPNPCQFQVLLDSKNELIQNQGRIQVAYINRMQYWKGFDLDCGLVESIAKQPFGFDRLINFHCFGNDAKLKEGSVLKPLGDKIILHGHVDTQVIQNSLSEMDVVIVPSRFESFSNVVLEAMMMKLSK